jgi:hypothetical protein
MKVDNLNETYNIFVIFLNPRTVKRLYRNCGYGTVKFGMWLQTSRCIVLLSVIHFTLLLVPQTTWRRKTTRIKRKKIIKHLNDEISQY